MTWQEMDTGDLLRIAAAYADLGYQGGYEAAMEATTDVLGAADRAGYEVKRRTETRQQEPDVPPLPDQFAERLTRMATEGSNHSALGDLPPDVLARWAGVSRGEAIRRVENLREYAADLKAEVETQREAVRDLQGAVSDLPAPGSLGLALDQRDQAIRDRAEVVAALGAKEEAMRKEASIFQQRITEADAVAARLRVSLNMAQARRDASLDALSAAEAERDEARRDLNVLRVETAAIRVARDAAYAVIRTAVMLRRWPSRNAARWVWTDGRETMQALDQYWAALDAAVAEGPADEPDPLRSERG